MALSKSILIVGGSGFVGTHLALKLREHYKVFATYRLHRLSVPGVTFIPIDLDRRNWVRRIVYTSRPDVIIYCAGPNDLEWAEANERLCDQIHASGPATILNESEILAPKYIYISNALAFDGSRGNYQENDIILPGTTLGKSKVSGENFIRGRSLNYIILRSSPLVGRGNGIAPSFLDSIRNALDRNQKIELPHQELQSYGMAEAFAECVVRLIESGVRNRVLHFGGLTKVTAYEFGKIFAKTFSYNPNLIIQKQATTKDSQKNEIHHSDFSLNFTQTIEVLKIKPLLLEEGFNLIQQKLIPTL